MPDLAIKTAGPRRIDTSAMPVAPHKIALLTREYPPDVYGGAGIHVEYLARELRHLADVSVHCWGSPRDEPGVTAYHPWSELAEPKPESTALQAMSINLAMAAGTKGTDLVHSHTWYANFGGHLSKLTWSIPHVVTTHSLEPLRPWKAEQLGGGYSLSRFCEETAIEAADAVIAVSKGMRQDVLDCYPNVDHGRVHVIHNGIDPGVYKPTPSEPALARLGVDPSVPFALFAGRVTRQKGLHLLLAAAHRINPRYQLVIVASSPDTPEIGAEVAALAERVRSERGNLVWIGRFIPLEEAVGKYRAAVDTRTSYGQSQSGLRMKPWRIFRTISTRAPRFSSAHRCMSLSASSTSRRWHVRRRWSRRGSAGSRRSWWRGRLATWSITTRNRLNRSRPLWRRGLMSCSQTRVSPPRWERPAASE